MSSKPWYRWYPGDYLQDTVHLSLEQDGAYRRMLDWSWANGPIPDSLPAIARIMRVHSQKARCLMGVLRGYFEERSPLDPPPNSKKGGYLISIKLEKGRVADLDKSLKCKEAGRISVEKNRQRNDNLSRSRSREEEEKKISEDRDLGISEDRDPSSTTPKSAREDMPSEKVEKGPKTKQGIPDCPHQAIIDIYHEECPTMRKVRTWEGERPKHLKARWSQNPDLEWWRGYLAYCAQSGFLTGQVNHFSADLEWLIRPRNFQRVNEGKYHEQPVQPTRPQIDAAHLLPDGSPKVTH